MRDSQPLPSPSFTSTPIGSPMSSGLGQHLLGLAQSPNFMQGIGGLLGQLFAGGGDPYSAYKSDISQIPNIIQQYYNPYIGAGTQALGTLQDQISKLLQNPSDILKQFGAGYQESPGYQFEVDEATKAANRAAAAGGMLGTPSEQASLANRIHQLANQDYSQYLGNIMNLYGRGFGGLQDIEHQGYGAATGAATNLANIQAAKAQADLADAYRKQQQGAGIGSLFGGLLSDVIGFL
ncbi:hypothetical protein [Flavobacterium sp.]|uniref:hypothetical protein n=1 Tax=Flavobacterium sp. TaxID=239 RepID=UPI003F69B491